MKNNIKVDKRKAFNLTEPGGERDKSMSITLNPKDYSMFYDICKLRDTNGADCMRELIRAEYRQIIGQLDN